MTKWWSRQADPFDVDPIWEGPFDTEGEALASLMVPPGESWGGDVYEEPDDFDPWGGRRDDMRSRSIREKRHGRPHPDKGQ